MTSNSCDILFAGAGLAGLSLAVRLAALPHPPRMILIDPRSAPPRDRTWCHWQLHDHPFTDAITHRWHEWTVSQSTRTTTARSATHPYARIPADRFHQLAHKKLSASPQVEFLGGISVSTLENFLDHATAELSDGRKISASWIIDSRPPQSTPAPWRQIFRGLELHSPAARLDTAAATLMDFQSADQNGIRFFYTLPLDPHTALVEDTWLAPAGRSPSFSDDEITAHAAKQFGHADWRIIHREEGDLPMGLQPADARGRLIPWGIQAGALRASSGYAFSRIQRASEKLAAAWQHTGSFDPAALRAPSLLDWMDRIFLRVMTRHPQRVPDFFQRLFDRVPTEALIRFLESTPRPADLLLVMRALPPIPFLAAALR